MVGFRFLLSWAFSLIESQVDLAELPALFCGALRNSPKLVGDTSRRHSSIPRGNSIDKGAPLAAPESSSILAFPETTIASTQSTIPESRDCDDEDCDLTDPAETEETTPMSYPVPYIQLLGPRKRFRGANSFDVIPNKQIERVNSAMKRSCHSLQVRIDHQSDVSSRPSFFTVSLPSLTSRHLPQDTKLFRVDSVSYDNTNNCDVIGNGALHCAPLLTETKKWHSLEDVPIPAHNRKPQLVSRSPIRGWLFNLFNGGTNIRNSDICLRKAMPAYVDLQPEKESIV